MNRRSMLQGLALGATLPSLEAASATKKQALIAVTFDLEMSRNFPRPEDTHWDYEKGNLNAETKRYAVEAAKRVKARGGAMHFFAVGQVFEQEDVNWLRELHAAGHRIGNHTYDHINITATRPGDIQHRFRRSPWLIEGKEPGKVVRENITLCSQAMQQRLGFAPVGFRTPGGFRDGLQDRADLRAMLRDLGFNWISSKYPGHAITKPGEPPTPAVLESIVTAQASAQPFRYADGLLEIPMSPISDVAAFRTCRWPLDDFLKAIHLAVTWCIEHGAVFDLLCHPSAMYPSDSEHRTIELICDLVQQAGDRARIATLDEIAAQIP